MRVYIRLIILFFSLSLAGALAQTTSFINYGVEQGLSQSQVQTITQDNEGNLWIGTLSGLTRYNGKTFKIYSRSSGLAEDWITASYKDTDGNIWFGHWAGGVSVYDQKRKGFDNLNLEEYTRFKAITAITQDEKGKFWIATEGSGIFIYEPRNGKMASLSKDNGLASDNVYAVCADAQNNMWIATEKGITVYDVKGDISSSSSFKTLNSTKGLPSDHVTALTLVNQGNEMWVGTADSGVTVLNLTGFTAANALNVLQGRKFVINALNELGSNFVETIMEDRDQRIWIGTTGGGVTVCRPAKTQTRREALEKAVFTTYSTRQGLNYYNANEIFQDREGSVWIGTDIGLNQYRGERFQIYDEADSLVNNLIWAIHCDNEGSIWMGTNNGVSKISFRYSAVNNKQLHNIKNYTVADGLPSAVVLSVFQDKAGNMWFGTGFGGVCRLDKNTGAFTTYSRDNGLAGNVVFSICEDNKGNMWFGTKEGASKLDPVTKAIRNFNIADGMGGNNVYRIFKDSKGHLWFGALGGSLSMYDGASFRKYDESNGMGHRFILSITEDREKNLWFGAYGGGLYRYNGKEFRNYNLRDGMTTETPYSLIADENNNIWIGHTRGIDKFDLKNERFYHYGKAEGFLGVESNPNASCMDKDGNLWFGTIMGAVRFNPREDRPNTVETNTFITGLKVFMKDAEFPLDGKFYYDQNHLTFTFVGVSLTNPEKIQYQYKLEGFDKEWIPGYTNTTQNEAVYSNVPPGTYTFMVRSCNNDGLWNAEATKYKFSVKPPFWQTSLFFIGMAVFILFCLYGADKIRTRNLKNTKKQLEEKVKLLARELAQARAELAGKNHEASPQQTDEQGPSENG